MKKIYCFLLITSTTLFSQGSGYAITNQSWANCGTNTILGFTSSFTIDAWVYPMNDGTNNDLVGEHSIIDRRYSYVGYQLRLNNGNLRFTVKSNDRSEHSVSTSGLVPNQWQHVAGVLVSENKVLSIYINGILKVSTCTGTYSIGNAATEFYFGKSKYVSSFYLYGSIDEVSGSSVADDSPNFNNGAVNAHWIKSGIPLGNESVANYSSLSSVSLPHSDGGFGCWKNIANLYFYLQLQRKSRYWKF